MYNQYQRCFCWRYHCPFCLTCVKHVLTYLLVYCLYLYKRFLKLRDLLSLFLSACFSSESPGQVFLLALHYLYNRLQDVDEKDWDKFVLSYDNMCNLCKMHATKEDLPLPAPYDKMWLKVAKVSDHLHLRNHKNPSCQKIFSPESLKERFPELNIPVAEQTFTWSARFKKILCAMPQSYFLFYYHRMVVRRNRYTSKCHKAKRSPVLPISV